MAQKRTETESPTVKQVIQETTSNSQDSADSSPRSLPLSDLSTFRRDLLFTISAFEGTDALPSGVAVAEDLQATYAEPITQGRFYQNLRELVADGLVMKRPIDGRTNAYYLRSSTAEALATHIVWEQHCLGAGAQSDQEYNHIRDRASGITSEASSRSGLWRRQS